MATTAELMGAQIRVLRKRKGWTLEKLGGMAGITRKGMSGIELGNSTTTDRLELVAEALGVEVGDFLPKRSRAVGSRAIRRGSGCSKGANGKVGAARVSRAQTGEDAQ